MKRPQFLIDAEAAMREKFAELQAAEQAVHDLRAEYTGLCVAVKDARVKADEALPQCDMYRIRWRAGTAEYLQRVVIIRKTPGGLLVVRAVGDHDGGNEYRFKLSGNEYRQAEKRRFFYDDLRELRNVPAKFMPTEAQQAVE